MIKKLKYDELEDGHVSNAYDTPLRPDAFELSDDEKVKLIEKHFTEIMHVLGLDLNDDSLRKTPYRVAKMYVKEVFRGLNPENRPKISLFENKYNYNQMLLERDIPFYSFCEHHFVPIMGKAHVAYFSSGKVIGLSKINRIVHYFARRPQVQERMTIQILNELKTVLQTEDVAVVLDASHLCVSCRGVQDQGSMTLTAQYSGKFQDSTVRSEFLNFFMK